MDAGRGVRGVLYIICFTLLFLWATLGRREVTMAVVLAKLWDQSGGGQSMGSVRRKGGMGIGGFLAVFNEKTLFLFFLLLEPCYYTNKTSLLHHLSSAKG